MTLARRGVVTTEVTNLNQAIHSYFESPEFEDLKNVHPHVIIKSKLETNLLNIMGSPVHLSKTIMNLVNNAAEAIVDGGNIAISTENRYIDQPIEGTTLTLYFPANRRKVEKNRDTLPIENYMGKGESILVVDDIEEQREIASRILLELGYSVNSVISGEEAVVYLKNNHADLLVSDMIMDPGIDGLETYKKYSISAQIKKPSLQVASLRQTGSKRFKELAQDHTLKNHTLLRQLELL